MTLREKADMLAARAHSGQVRKTDGSPYITHPRAVAALLAANGFSEVVVAAALVHDVPEDTSVTIEELRRELGDEVARIVHAVSEDKTLPWEARKAAYIKSVRSGDDVIKAVSVADKIHNVQTLLTAYAEQGSTLWDKFSRNKDKKFWFEEQMLEMFKETWAHPLVDDYEVLVERMRALM